MPGIVTGKSPMSGRKTFESSPYRCGKLESYTKKAFLSMQKRLKGEETGEGWTLVVSHQKRKVRDFLSQAVLQYFADHGMTAALLSGRDLVNQHLNKSDGYLRETHAVGVADAGETRGMEMMCVKQLVFDRQRNSLFTVIATSMSRDWFKDVFFDVDESDGTELFFTGGKYVAR